MSIFHNWQWWMVGLDIHGPLQKGSRRPSLAASTQTLTHLILMIPIFHPQKQGLGSLGYGWAKSPAWAPGSMNDCGLSKSRGPHCLHMGESWHLMVIEMMKMEIYKYICCWSRVTAVLELHVLNTKHQTANSSKTVLWQSGHITRNIGGEITGFSNSSLFFLCLGFSYQHQSVLLFLFFFSNMEANVYGWILNLMKVRPVL